MADQQITLQQLEHRLAGWGNIPLEAYLNRLEGDSTDNHEDASSRTCSFCCEDLHDFRVFQCGHLLCGPCIGKLVQKGSSDMYFPAKCCGLEINIDDVKDIIDPKVVEAYTARQEESVVPILDRGFCSTPTCSKLLHPDLFSLRVEAIGQAECFSCEASTCWCCCGPVIPGEHECKANWLDEASAKHVLADGKVKQCPRCWILVEHKEACNHMTCAFCEHQYCFICLTPYPCSNNCPMYNGHEVDEQGYYPTGFHKGTGRDREGYDRQGYDTDGYNRAGEPIDECHEPDDDREYENDTEPDDDQHDPINRDDVWPPGELQAAGEIDWDTLSEGALADHQAAQMDLDVAQGNFAGQDHRDHQEDDVGHAADNDEAHAHHEPDGAEAEALDDQGADHGDPAPAVGNADFGNEWDDEDVELQMQLMESLAIHPQDPQETPDEEQAHAATANVPAVNEEVEEW